MPLQCISLSVTLISTFIIIIIIIIGIPLEKVDKFCYLGDMLDADGGCDSAVTARVRYAWKKFREYLTHTNWKRILVSLVRNFIK